MTRAYTCLTCKKEFFRNVSRARESRVKYCTPACSKTFPNMPVGKAIDRSGYILVLVNGKYIPEHRHIMAKAIGRELLPTEVVHHLNHQKADNRLENLVLMGKAEHIGLHATERAPAILHRTRTKHGFFMEKNGTWKKPCKKCGNFFTLDCFYKKSYPHRNVDGMTAKCKECHNQDRKKSR